MGIWPILKTRAALTGLFILRDMILHYPKELDTVSRDFLIWDWNYWSETISKNQRCANIWGVGMVDCPEQIPKETMETFPEIIRDEKINPFYTTDFLRRKGYEVILCGASRSDQDSVNCGRHQVHARNIFSCARKTGTDSLAGFCMTSWAVRLHPYETQEQWIRLAPLACSEISLTYQEALDRVSTILFGQVYREFFSAIEAIGNPFPLNTSKQLGIQWNQLKDATMPPDDFFENMILKLKRESPELWDNIPADLEKRNRDIQTGLSLLNRLFSELAFIGAPGLEVIGAWLDAGHMQLIHLALANAAIRYTDGRKIPTACLNELTAAAQRLFIAIHPGETERSSAWNAALIFEPLLNYINK